MRTIPLTQGYEALVDDEDFASLNQHLWSADVRVDGNIYAFRMCSGRKTYMHREIMGVLDAGRLVEVDHRDTNTLNNQKHNLKTCQHAYNSRNRRDAKITSRTGVRNVTFDKQTGKYRVLVMLDGKQYSFGRYETLEQASIEAERARTRLFGSQEQ